MANFKPEFEKLIVTEGGYVDDPDDKGGETYLGISRKAHPHLSIWKDIDAYKKKYPIKDLTKYLKLNKNITERIANVYKTYYWDVFELDSVPNQKVAHQIFDDAVNRGVRSATRLIQQVMGMTVTGVINEALLYNLKRYV